MADAETAGDTAGAAAAGKIVAADGTTAESDSTVRVWEDMTGVAVDSDLTDAQAELREGMIRFKEACTAYTYGNSKKIVRIYGCIMYYLYSVSTLFFAAIQFFR
eukprot:SAG22_NODE_4879_length_1143_cov_1.158046_1_plen_104_part_00